MNRSEIEGLLPHREPMLLVDELSLTDDGIAHGVYHTRGDEWFFQGHFPGNPVMPGVIQCEIMAQACALLLGDRLLGNTAYYTGMDKIKFKNKIVPGDTIEVSARLNRCKEPFYFTHAEAKVDGRLCCEGELSFALVEGR